MIRGWDVSRLVMGRGTWLDSESLAYNTYAGGPCGSGRRARALCDDGKLRTFRAGVPDTYFTIPAVGRIAGRYVRGRLTVGDDDTLRFYCFPRP